MCDGFTGRRRSTTCAHVEVFSEKKSIEVYHFRAQEDGRTPTALCRAAMLLEMTCSPRAGRGSRRKAPSFGGIWHHLAPVERLSGGCDRCHHGAKRSGAQDFEASEAPATSARRHAAHVAPKASPAASRSHQRVAMLEPRAAEPGTSSGPGRAPTALHGGEPWPCLGHDELVIACLLSQSIESEWHGLNG